MPHIPADYDSILQVLHTVLTDANVLQNLPLSVHVANVDAHHRADSASLNIVPASVVVNGAGANLTAQNSSVGEDGALAGLFKFRLLSSTGAVLASLDSGGRLVVAALTAAATNAPGTTTLENLVVTGNLTVQGNTTLGDTPGDLTSVSGPLHAAGVIDARAGITNTVTNLVLVTATGGLKANTHLTAGGTVTAETRLVVGTGVPLINGQGTLLAVNGTIDVGSAYDITRAGANGVFAHVTNSGIHVTATIGAALVAAQSPSGTNPYLTLVAGNDLYAPRAHSDNSDLHITPTLKQALTALTPAPSQTNFFITKVYLDANTVTSTHVGDNTHVTTTQRAALDASLSPSAVNEVLTKSRGDALYAPAAHVSSNLHLTAAERDALTAGNSPPYSTANPILNRQAADARYIQAALASAGQAENQLRNSSFERWYDGRPFYWELVGVGVVVDQSSAADSGLYAAKVTATAPNGRLSQTLSTTATRFLRGKNVAVGFTVARVTSAEARVVIRDISLGVLHTASITAAGTVTSSFIVAIPTGAVQLVIDLIPDPGGSQTSTFDTIHLREGGLIGSWSPSPEDAADAPGFFNRAYHTIFFKTPAPGTFQIDVTTPVTGIPISTRADQEGLVTFPEGGANLVVLLDAQTSQPFLNISGDLVYGHFVLIGAQRVVTFHSFDGSTETTRALDADVELVAFIPRVFKFGRVPPGLRIGDLNAITAIQLLFVP